LALKALIAAYHESAEEGALRATLPLAGRTVVERQARLAASVGARSIILIVERMPADLSAAINRLRRDRIPVHVARSAEEAASAVDVNDRLLLVADGAVADPAQLERFLDEPVPKVLTMPDSGVGEVHERIDAKTRWAGIASFDGAMLRDTAGMLRDWDLQSTLLRRTLQAGAGHVVADGPVAILDRQSDIAGLERQIVANAGEADGGWVSKLLAPIERTAVQALMVGPVSHSAIGSASAAAIGLAGIAFAYGWYWPGLVLSLIATPLEGIATRLARMRMQDDFERSWWCQLLPMLAGGALIALSYSLALVHGWGMLLLGSMTPAFLFALGVETEGRKAVSRFLHADRRALTWLMLPFALFGAWHAGVAALFAYAAASFFGAQQMAHHPSPAAPRATRED
jgi:hypothetical protein